jgi:hypothetical protein
MKVHNRTLALSISTAIALAFILVQCKPSNFNTASKIRKVLDELAVINTHEHQRSPHEIPDERHGFYHLLQFSYLNSDVHSAGSWGYEMEKLDSLGADELWDTYGPGLNYSRNTSYYGHFVKGFKKLYNFNDLYFTKDNIITLSGQIEENYQDYGAWFDKAFKKAGFDLMFNDQYWAPFNCELNDKYFALVFHINPLVMEASNKPEEGMEKGNIYKQADIDGFEIANLDDYLRYCDFLFKKNVEHNAVCVKNSMAYSRSLDYEDIPYEEAKKLYDKSSSSLTPQEAKKLQDFMFHWVIQRSVDHELPIQIHTGYLAGNGNVLDNGKPVKLNNLFLQYPEAKFVLFHGGFPWTGEYAAFGKMFPNVYLDIVWLPQISREEAVSALDVMLDCMPYNKFFWGGDCALIEETTGSLEFGKDVLVEVLTKRIERGLLTEDVAIDIARSMFRENAIEVFQLDRKLERDFDRMKM